MKLKRVFLTAGSLAVVLGIVWSAFGPAVAQEKKADRPAMKWEYKVVRSEPVKNERQIDWEKMQATLNKLGEEGWECIGPMGELAGSEQQSYWMSGVLICKRPKQ